MQSEITIYSAATGEPIANALHEDGSVLRVELMKTDEMQLRFTLANAVAIGVGDYAVHPETRRRYVCSERYCPEYNSSTGSYSYALTMQAEYREYLSSHRMMYVSTVPKFADGVGLRYVKKRTETKWQLTATLAEHAALLLSNLHVLGLLYIDPVTGEKKEWQLQVHEENIGAYISETEEPSPVHKFLSYDNQTLLEALNTLCSTENFDCEWWFDGCTLHFGRLEREEEGTLSLIQGLNAESISKDGSARSYCNRLFAFGSTQNISERYRKTFLPKINTVEEWNMDEIEAKGYSFTEFYNLYSPSIGSTEPNPEGKHGDENWFKRNPHKVFRVTLTMPDGITGVTEGTIVKMLPKMFKKRPTRSLYYEGGDRYVRPNNRSASTVFHPTNTADAGFDDFLGVEGRYEITGCPRTAKIEVYDGYSWRDVSVEDGITATVTVRGNQDRDNLCSTSCNLAQVYAIKAGFNSEYLYQKKSLFTDNFEAVRCKTELFNVSSGYGAYPQEFSGVKAPLLVIVDMSIPNTAITSIRFRGRLFDVKRKGERIVTCRPKRELTSTGYTKFAFGYDEYDLPMLYKADGFYEQTSHSDPRPITYYRPHIILNYRLTAYGDGDLNYTLTNEEAEERMAELLLVYPLKKYDEVAALTAASQIRAFHGYTDQFGIGTLSSYKEECTYQVMYSTTQGVFVMVETYHDEFGYVTSTKRYAIWKEDAFYSSEEYRKRDKVYALYDSENKFVAYIYFSSDGTRREVFRDAPRIIDHNGDQRGFVYSDKWFPEVGDVLRFQPERLDNDELPVQYIADLSATIKNGLAERRLQLPEETGGYIQSSEDLAEEEIVEDTLVCDEIYPKQDNSVGEIRTKTKQEDITHEDGRVETKDYLVYDVRGSDEGFLFRSGFILDGSELKIRFTTGSLAGMEFGCGFNPDGVVEYTLDDDGNTVFNQDAQWYRIVRNEDYGLMLPNDILNPKVGDKFILLGFDIAAVTETAITAAAEERLLKRAQQELDKRQRDGATYKAVMMCDDTYYGGYEDNFIKTYDKLKVVDASGRVIIITDRDNKGYTDRIPTKGYDILAEAGGSNVVSAEGSQVLVQHVLSYSDRIPLLGRPAVIYDKAYFGGEDGESYKMRIIGYEVKLDIPYDKQVIYCGESASYSRLQRLERSINK